MPHAKLSRTMLATIACSSIFLATGAARAQEVKTLSLSGVPPDMIQEGAPPSAPMSTQATPSSSFAAQNVDLGEKPAGSSAAAAAGANAAPQAARVAASAAQSAARAGRVGGVRRVTAPNASMGTERAVFSREPIRVTLQVGRERLITLPAPAALHVPIDMESVARLEIIDRTIYAKALVPFAPLRVVAELVDTGQQVPLDLVASADAVSTAELEVSVSQPQGAASAAAAMAATGASYARTDPDGESPAADMVQLTRYAARMLYAPRRLASGSVNVHQVALQATPVTGLLRGVDVDAMPLGQWKSGALYVTAVRVTNRGARAVELPLESLRGRWLAATAQHGRVGARGTDTDTTAIYLICDRSFEACL